MLTIHQNHELDSWRRSVRSVEGVSTVPSLAAALAGLGFGMSLIVVIGAQNAFVLRTGALATLRRHIGVVVLICTVSDAVLIAAGVAGAAAAIRSGHWVLPAVEGRGRGLPRRLRRAGATPCAAPRRDCRCRRRAAARPRSRLWC